MTSEITPNDLAKHTLETGGVQEAYRERFRKMSDSRLAGQLANIILTADEGVPRVNPRTNTNLALKKLLECLLAAKAPERVSSEGGSAGSWQICIDEVIRRIAKNDSLDRHEVPDHGTDELAPDSLTEIMSGVQSPAGSWAEFIAELNRMEAEADG